MTAPTKPTTFSTLVVVVANTRQQAGLVFPPVWKQANNLSAEFSVMPGPLCAELSVERVRLLLPALGLEADAALGTFFVRQTQFRGARTAVVCAGVVSLDPLGRKYLPLRLHYPVEADDDNRQLIMQSILNL